MNVGRKGVSWRTTSSSLNVSRTHQGKQDKQQGERDQGFLTDSPKDKAEGPADVSHNELQYVLPQITPLLQQNINLVRLH